MIQQNDRTTTTSSAKSATTTMNNNNNSKARRISDQHHQNHHQHAHHHFPQQQHHHKTTPATQSNVSSTSSTTQPGHQAEEEMRIDLISRVLTSGDITREHLHKDDLALNSIQLINFMHFYYDEGQSTSVWALNENGSVHEKQPISVCFPCIACSYKFSFEHTFHQHLDRRSFVIRLNCLKCGMFKTFFNKCKLFYHIYSHKVHLLEPIFKSVQIEPMPIDKMNQFMFGTGTAAADSNKSAFQHQYLDLDMLFNNFEGLCDEWEVNANSHSHTLASFSLSNRILNNRFKIHEIDIHELKLFIKKLMINRYLIFKCGVCDALFFDARELRTHFAKSQAAEFSNTGSSSLLPADVANTLVKSPEALSLEEEQILSQHKKLHLKSLMTKHVAFEASSFVRNNMMMNTVSFKKLQYTTRCYTLALLNTFTSNFKLYKNSNPQQADVVEVEPSPTSPPTSNHHQQQQPQHQPLICPECGLSFDAKSKEGHARFRHHLLYECLFTLKHQVAELKCAIRGCSFSTESEQQMVAHWSQAHLVKRFECNLCAVQCGLRYAFDDVKNHLVYANKNGHSTNGPVTYGNLLKYVVNGREHQSNRATCNESRLLNEALVTHINEHQTESHRGEQVELKLVYKCLCKRVQHQQKYMQMGGAVQLSAADDCNEDELELDECAHDDWKSCRLHILAAASQPVYSLKCAKCQGLIVHKDFKSVMSDYAEHMRIHRDTDNESFFLCPICGIVKKERTLNEHVVKNHNQLNLNRHPTSCFYNMVTSLLDLSPDRVQDKSHLNPNNPNLFSFKFLAENFPKDYYIYFCLNCRLFYSSNSTFSHNCWTVSMSSGAEKSDSANSASNSNSNSKPLTNGSGKPQSSAANNYFSPIYLKFNVRQLFDKSSAGNATTSIASKQTPTQEAETSGVETATSSSNGPIKPSTSSSSSSSSLSSSKQQNNDSTAFSNKRMRVDSIIEKLKP